MKENNFFKSVFTFMQDKFSGNSNTDQIATTKPLENIEELEELIDTSWSGGYVK